MGGGEEEAGGIFGEIKETVTVKAAVLYRELLQIMIFSVKKQFIVLISKRANICQKMKNVLF